MIPARGTLIVRPICARLTRDTDFMSRMDPYCQITIGNQVQRTKIAPGAGKNPAWQDQLVFKMTTEDMMRVTIYDYDFNSRDDVVAEGSCPLSRFTQQPNVSETVELAYKGRRAGDITISTTYTLDAGYAPQAPNVVLVAAPQPYPVYQSPPAYPVYQSPPAYQPAPVYQPPPGYQTQQAYQPAPLYQGAQGYQQGYQPPPGYGVQPGYQDYGPGFGTQYVDPYAGTYPCPNFNGHVNPEAHLHHPDCPHHY